MNKNAKYKLVTNSKPEDKISELKKRYEKILVGNKIEIIQKSFYQYAKELESH